MVVLPLGVVVVVDGGLVLGVYLLWCVDGSGACGKEASGQL
jgi:hypothetical protein